MSPKALTALLTCVAIVCVSVVLLPLQRSEGQTDPPEKTAPKKPDEFLKAGVDDDNQLNIEFERLEKIREKLRSAVGKDKTVLEAEELKQQGRVAEILVSRLEKGPPGTVPSEAEERNHLREIARLPIDIAALRKTRDKQKTEVEQHFQIAELDRKLIITIESCLNSYLKVERENAKKLAAIKTSEKMPPPPPIPEPPGTPAGPSESFELRSKRELKSARQRYSQSVSHWLDEQEKLTKIEIDLRTLELDLKWQTEDLPRLMQRNRELWERIRRGENPEQPDAGKKDARRERKKGLDD